MSLKSSKTVNCDFITASKCIKSDKVIVSGDLEVSGLKVDTARLDVLLKLCDYLAIKAPLTSDGRISTTDEFFVEISTGDSKALDFEKALLTLRTRLGK